MATEEIRSIERLLEIAKSQNIYLYGMGIYGKLLYSFLKECGVDVKGFYVSDIKQTDTGINKYVSSIEEYREGCIFISVSEIHKREIVHELEKRHITDYYSISEETYEEIEKNTSYKYPVSSKRSVQILYYHRILDEKKDFWQLNTHINTFREHIKMLSSTFNIVSFQDDWDQIDEDSICITFDDGYCDNYYNALPILEEYKVPATFFVSTDMLNTGKAMWWDELENNIIWCSNTDSIIFDNKDFSLKSIEEKQKACMEIRNSLRFFEPETRKKIMESLSTNVNMNVEADPLCRMLSIDELKKLAASEYVSIGCHTKSHISLGKIKEDIILEEVLESKKILESILRDEITAFSYPYGQKEDFSSKSEECLKIVGIKKAVTTVSGLVYADTNLLSLPRQFAGNVKAKELERMIRKLWCIAAK